MPARASKRERRAASSTHRTHPYTRALLACHPERAQAFIGIPGAVPSPLRAAARLPLRTALRRGVAGCARGRRTCERRPGHAVDCMLYDRGTAA